MRIKSFREFVLLKESIDVLKLSLPKPILKLNKLFKKSGHSLYVVGGAVRDAILGIKPKDFDLVTDAKPEQIQNILNNAGIKNYAKGEAFGIISALINGTEFEIATFRQDIGRGRRPDFVEFTTIDKDVLRRDLTINALFYDIDKEKIVDLVGGVKDLLDKVIKTVGNPLDRFGEDPLRKLRALRFASRLGAKLDHGVHLALSKDEFKDYKYEESLASVSKERIKDEFSKSIIKAKSPSTYLQWLADYNYWLFIFPVPDGYSPNDDSFINKRWIDSNNFLVQVATLLKNVDLFKNIKYANTLKTKFAYTNDEIKKIQALHLLMNFEPSQILVTKKFIDSSNLDLNDAIEFCEYNSIDVNLVKAIYNYKLSIKTNDDRLSGLLGKELGDKIKELEAENFKKYFLKYN